MYRKHTPTAAQKASAHAFYSNVLPKDPLELGIDKLLALPDVQDAIDAEENHSMRGKLASLANIRDYVTAGNATFTVQSKATGARFTYRCRMAAPKPGMLAQTAPIFVSVLNGPDNTNSYAYLGCLWATDAKWGHRGGMRYAHGKKSSVTVNAACVKALLWLVGLLESSAETRLLGQCDVWHEGRCGRCGRKLTVPASIERGIGPDCATKV